MWRPWNGRGFFTVVAWLITVDCLHFLSASGDVQFADQCPDVCFCNTVSRIVYCSRRGLGSIPGEIPDDTIQLNLNGNHFRHGTVRRRNFSSFVELEHLYLSECSVDAVEVGAFEALKSLRWLDMSNNRIRIIEPETFRGLRLQHLFLNGNRNLVLVPDSFAGFLTTGLYLHDCSLVSVDPDVFRPLNATMRYLWLNGNDMERIDPDFRSVFATLLHLRLGTNPLDCGCDAVWLKKFFDENVEILRGSLPPSCLTPRKLRGRYFNELAPFDLRCRAPQFTTVEAHFGPEATRLRCSASGLPVPVLYWTGPSGSTVRFVPSSEGDDWAQDHEAVLTVPLPPEADRRDHVTENYICSASNDAGNVTLTVSVPSTAMTSGKGSTTSPNSVTQVETEGWADQSSIVTQVQISVPDLAGESDRRLLFHHPEPNETQPDLWRRLRTDRTFSLAELAWAVMLTHLGTMTVSLLVVVVVFFVRRRRASNKNAGFRRDARRPDDARGSYANMNFAGPKMLFAANRVPSECRSSCPNVYKNVSSMRAYNAADSKYVSNG